jgi:glycosyltransferase involved in cell wall biosynthesis
MVMSLRLQTESNIEIVIADNSDDNLSSAKNQLLEASDSRIYYVNIGEKTCYRSSNAAVAIPRVQGDYLCFPSDDGYYVPGFAQLMIEAAEKNNWDLVYCDLVDDARQLGYYGVRDVKPALGYIDKTCYIVKREVFESVGGFPLSEDGNDWAADWAADWWLVEKLIALGVSHGKLAQLLVVHN